MISSSGHSCNHLSTFSFTFGTYSIRCGGCRCAVPPPGGADVPSPVLLPQRRCERSRQTKLSTPTQHPLFLFTSKHPLHSVCLPIGRKARAAPTNTKVAFDSENIVAFHFEKRAQKKKEKKKQKQTLDEWSNLRFSGVSTFSLQSHDPTWIKTQMCVSCSLQPPLAWSRAAPSTQTALTPESWAEWIETQEWVPTWVTSVFWSVCEWGTSSVGMKWRIWRVSKWWFSCCPQDHFLNNSGNKTLFQKTFYYTQSTVNPFTLLKQVHNVSVHL